MTIREKNVAEPELQELSEFLSNFNKESDRGAVLIAASLIDEWLAKIIQSFLAEVRASNDLLLGPNAPLGTFAARTKIAFSLGLIQDNEYSEIEIIRKIRNEFGHKWKDVGFSNPKIKLLCDRLPWLGPLEIEENSDSRSRFNFLVAILLTDLMWRSRLVKKERRLIKIWPNKSR
jgi:mannitol operon repressor